VGGQRQHRAPVLGADVALTLERQRAGRPAAAHQRRHEAAARSDAAAEVGHEQGPAGREHAGHRRARRHRGAAGQRHAVTIAHGQPDGAAEARLQTRAQPHERHVERRLTVDGALHGHQRLVARPLAADAGGERATRHAHAEQQRERDQAFQHGA